MTYLNPGLKKFGRLKLTYGFCDQTLAREIKKRSGGIYPPLDQHAGMEFKKNGSLVSPRGGLLLTFIACRPLRWMLQSMSLKNLNLTDSTTMGQTGQFMSV